MQKTINHLLAARFFPVTFKFLTLFAFGGLIFIGLIAKTDNPVLEQFLYRTNFTSIFVWDIWWPLIIILAILFGRIWCMVCPVEMVTSFFAKIGMKKRRPRWILSGWVITAFYAAIVVIGITILEIDLSTRQTVWYLLIIVGISILAGLIFEKNTFCRYICPVGYVLAICSKMAGWGWRVKDKNVCKNCTDKSCISRKYLYQQNFKSCGVDLVPAEITDSDACILCAGCLKTCNKYRTEFNSARPNPALVKTGFASELLQMKPFKPAEWFFLFLITAHLIDEISEFRVLSMFRENLFAGSFSDLAGFQAGIGKDIIGTGFLFFLLAPLLWILPYLLARFTSRDKISLDFYTGSFSLVFLPIILGMFVGLIIMEITTRVPYYRYMIADPAGVETLRGLLTRQIILTRLPSWTDWLFFSLLIAFIIAGTVLGYRMINKLMPAFNLQRSKIPLISSFLLFILLFLVLVTLHLSF